VIVELHGGGRADVREMQDEDLPFVVASWVDSQRATDQWRAVPIQTYKAGMRARVARLVERSTVLVACDIEDAAHLLGCVVAGSGVIHFLFVKGAFRGFGLGKELARAAIPDVGTVDVDISAFGRPLPSRGGSPETPFAELAKRWRLVFNPFAAKEAP
jgi:hypothetical protein